ncbi:RsbR, positive regulator of sigma-B [Jeotgalibacillus salarius]|uniref:RsbR, positive regulator of sigma-B n=1 Tax=Jeotgalibacillus salarius TaxID=546023 RepID=A0A4Y8LNA5_9BACL|nr:RsbR, positive regulator of sigma-B [Jeotgalibacillus salarius]TFE02233.1 RsbR, positive regulator of sigma-B [Jeotgalibacillus salarius]
MTAYGTIPETISPLQALDSIGETILLADLAYNIQWMNKKAAILLDEVALLYGLSGSSDMIGKNMDLFHRTPGYQKRIMPRITETHRARITIREIVVTDIVITPIRSEGEIQGFVIMLMDVTTKAEEYAAKEKLIKDLSTPIMKVWHNAIALPLIGSFDQDRFDLLVGEVLQECSMHQIDYALINVSKIHFDEEYATTVQFQKLIDCLRLIGTECMIVAVPPSLAVNMTGLDRDVMIHKNAYEGLKYIIARDE